MHTGGKPYLCCKAQNVVSAHFLALNIDTNVNVMKDIIIWETIVINHKILHNTAFILKVPLVIFGNKE